MPLPPLPPEEETAAEEADLTEGGALEGEEIRQNKRKLLDSRMLKLLKGFLCFPVRYRSYFFKRKKTLIFVRILGFCCNLRYFASPLLPLVLLLVAACVAGRSRADTAGGVDVAAVLLAVSLLGLSGGHRGGDGRQGRRHVLD